jgi:signal transduction histidine kinase
MFEWVLNYRLDAASFALMLVIVALTLHLRLQRKHGRGMPRASWAGLVLLLVATAFAPELAGEHERMRLRDMLSGIAPTYAQELALMGHAKITEQTSPDDPAFLAMIEAQKRWEKVNANVSDVYTFRKHADGTVVLLVDSETDYNRNGVYDNDDDREQRTPIGEVYDGVTPSLLQAFDGEAEFDAVPYTDRWGTWVSAYAPMRDKHGNVEAVLGVDYDASQWHGAIAWNRAAALGFVAILAVIMFASSMIVVVTRAELDKRLAAEQAKEKLQQQLLVASRQAGMAEVATGVLHNVGNVLNSVNVSAGLLTDKIAKSKVTSLNKATAMIQENRAKVGEFLTIDPRGKLLPDYLVQLGGMLSAEQDAMAKELSLLTASVDHIKQIVAAQQSFAKNVDTSETFDVAAVFEDAVRLNMMSLERHRIEIVRRFGRCGAVTADRHRVLQILVNLMSNAKQALDRNTNGTRQITLSCNEIEENGRAMARIAVTDTGIGIDSDHLPKIFSHGFTTRSDGHGFGLHSAAIAAQQMKGKLAAASDGLGKGATFTLTIPLVQEMESSCK